MIRSYQEGLTGSIGSTEIFISGNTLQVKDYSRYHWTLFDPAQKQARHETVFPEERKMTYELGRKLLER